MDMNTNVDDKLGYIFGRRSIRLYSSAPVSEAAVQKLLEAATRCQLPSFRSPASLSATPGETKESRTRFNRGYVHFEKW